MSPCNPSFFLVLAGCFAGTLIAALPGIGPINGVAILLPIAYGLGFPPEAALILLAGIYYGAEYGGRISSILLGALLLFNVAPGPLMFEQRPEIARGLIASMYNGNLTLLVINLPLAGLFARMLSIPQQYLTPLIAVLAFIDVYSMVSNPTIST
ncbi:tripartite tricarboxylate transporter permease [Nitratireductor rhodophyticola]|uniref:tripartite tricarboxylate transporter permease n=1 Tax=Nitratireductor rhodophyticola TaxID=2854036 RepID=UPI00300A3EDD